MTRLLAIVGTIGISFSAIFVRLADVSPATASVGRTGYAIPFLAIAWLFGRNRDRRSASNRALGFAAGLFLAVDLFLWHHSIAYIGASLATVLANVQVVFVGVLAWILHNERPSTTSLIMVPVVFTGVCLISGLGGSDAYGADPVRGVAFGVAAGLAYTGFLLTFRHSNRALAPPAGPLLDATIGAFAGSLLFALIGGAEITPTWPAHGWLLALAVVAQVAGWLLITTALPRLPALDTSALLLLQPMATVIWGFVVFQEMLSVVQWSGVVLVLGGIAVLTTRGTTTG